MARKMFAYTLPVVAVAISALGYHWYQRWYAMPPVHFVGATALGQRPAWVPAEAELTLQNTSSAELTLAGLTKY